MYYKWKCKVKKMEGNIYIYLKNHEGIIVPGFLSKLSSVVGFVSFIVIMMPLGIFVKSFSNKTTDNNYQHPSCRRIQDIEMQGFLIEVHSRGG